jgi:hypothetical protein
LCESALKGLNETIRATIDIKLTYEEQDSEYKRYAIVLDELKNVREMYLKDISYLRQNDKSKQEN